MQKFTLLALLALVLLGCGASSTPPPSPTGEAPSRTHKGQNKVDPQQP